MSAEQNTEQIQQVFEAFGRGDVPFILSQLSDDVRFVAHLDPSVPWAGEYVGKDAVAGYFQAMGSSVEVTGHPITSVVAQDDTVIARGGVSFRVRESGRPGESEWVYVFTLADAKVTRFEQFNDTGLATAFG